MLPPAAKLALMTAAELLRVLPELDIGTSLLGLHHQLASGLWSASFGTWLIGCWPILNDPQRDEGGCGWVQPRCATGDAFEARRVPVSTRQYAVAKTRNASDQLSPATCSSATEPWPSAEQTRATVPMTTSA